MSIALKSIVTKLFFFLFPLSVTYFCTYCFVCIKPTWSRPSLNFKSVWVCLEDCDGKHLSPGCPGFFKACYYFIIFQPWKSDLSHILASITEAVIDRGNSSAVQASLKKGKCIIIIYLFIFNAAKPKHAYVNIHYTVARRVVVLQGTMCWVNELTSEEPL